MILFALVSGGPGGGQQVALAVARRLVALGRPVGAVAPDTGPSLTAFADIGARVATTGRIRSLSPRSHRSVSALLADWDLDCIYTHTVPGEEIIFATAARRLDARLVVHRHFVSHFSPALTRGSAQRLLWRRALRGADAVIGVAPDIVEDTAQIGRRTSVLVPNGVPVAPFTVREPRSSPTVGFIGRFDRHKRLHDFIAAAGTVARAHPDVRFVVLGSEASGDPYGDECRRLARTMDLGDRLTFLDGTTSGRQLMSQLDVLVLPSEREGHPLVLLEAMAAGTPVVVSDIATHRSSVVAGIEGWLTPVGDVEAIAAAVLDTLSDPARALETTRAAHARASRDFTETLMVDRLLPLVQAP